MLINKIWKIKEPLHFSDLSTDSRQGPICPLVASLLRIRGIESAEAQDAFLYKKDERYLSDPWSLPDMLPAVERLLKAIHEQHKMIVYGDYDVDGMTATAILWSVLKNFGARAEYHIPDRQEEGYGLRKDTLAMLRSQGADLVVTVDCGITAVEEAAYAAAIGLDLIITDHHQPQERLPQALAVINPKRFPEERPDFHLAGVGVALKLTQCLCERLGQPAAALAYMDLAALGTVADVVPLTGDNRIIVSRGLIQINRTPRTGLASLIEASGLAGKEIQSGSIAFGLAPRLNAAGRMTKGSLGVELLTASDPAKAAALAREMDEANKQRQIIEAGIAEDALHKIESSVDLNKERMIVLASDQWHSGVIGIVASRLTEQFHRPVLLVAFEGNIGKGSARSIQGFDIQQALHAASLWLAAHGGHEMAAGCSLEAAQYPALKEALLAYAEEHLSEHQMIPVKTADLEVDASLLDMDLVGRLSDLAPFGAGNPQPVFVLRNARLQQTRAVGIEKQHLKMSFLAGGRTLDGIAFNMGRRYDEISQLSCLDLMFIPEINQWNDHASLQLLIKDIKDHEQPDDLQGPQDFIERLFAEGSLWQEDDFYRDLIQRETFFTKVAGISFGDRSLWLGNVTPGDAMELRPEPENPYDPNAIAVYFQDRQLGYLKSGLARHIAESVRQGTTYGAYAAQVTGGHRENKGLNLVIYKDHAQSVLAAGDTAEDAPISREAVFEKLQILPPEQQLERIRQAILGQGGFHEKQEEALENLRQGNSTLLVMGTGRGKTAVFEAMAAFHAINGKGITLLVYPLRSLVNDQFQRFQNQLGPLGIGTAIANGGLNSWERKAFFKKLLQKQIQIVMTTPEFLDIHKSDFMPVQRDLRLLVIDEAHHLAQTHRSGYKKIGKVWSDLGKPVVLAATATANQETAEKIRETFQIGHSVFENHCRINLQLVDARTCDDKLTYLLDLLTGQPRCVIYVNSRRQAYELAAKLRSYLPHLRSQIAFYHGGLDRACRQTLETMVQQGQINILVSTSAFGEGIDVRNIRDVVLYHMCFAKSEYNQLSGRAGRDGLPARIHLLYGREDHQLNQFILQSTAPDRNALGQFYLYLREEAKRQNPLSMTNLEIVEALKAKGLKDIGERTVAACLGILEELGLLLREQDAGRRYIHMAPPPPSKLDLNHSSRYLEGQDESMAFAEYAELAFSDNMDLLLESISRPILPDES